MRFVAAVNRMHRKVDVFGSASSGAALHRPPPDAISDPGSRRQVAHHAGVVRRAADVPAAAERLQKDAPELVPDGAVQYEVDSAVDVDEQVAHVRQNDVCRGALHVRRIHGVRHVVRQRRYLRQSFNQSAASTLNRLPVDVHVYKRSIAHTSSHCQLIKFKRHSACLLLGQIPLP